MWKKETVTPAPKVTNPNFKELRKISSTSDFSKVFEGFLKAWIVSDISHNIDVVQFGGQAAKGTEHMMVMPVDRILKLLDSSTDPDTVIAKMIDWSNAFDRQDPTLAICNTEIYQTWCKKIPLLISYLQQSIQPNWRRTPRNPRVK